MLSIFLIANILHGQNMLKVIHLGKKILPILSNSTGRYYKLVTTMVNFITNRSGTSKFVMEFVVSCDYLKLRIDVDISLLNNIVGYLFTYALDFLKLWYTCNHMSQTDSYITHPHMWDMVKNWVKEKGELKDSVVNFMRKKFKMPFYI